MVKPNTNRTKGLCEIKPKNIVQFYSYCFLVDFVRELDLEHDLFLPEHIVCDY